MIFLNLRNKLLWLWLTSGLFNSWKKKIIIKIQSYHISSPSNTIFTSHKITVKSQNIPKHPKVASTPLKIKTYHKITTQILWKSPQVITQTSQELTVQKAPVVRPSTRSAPDPKHPPWVPRAAWRATSDTWRCARDSGCPGCRGTWHPRHPRHPTMTESYRISRDLKWEI